MDTNNTDLFELINEWATALPNGHENASKPSSDTFNKLGNDIKQRLNESKQPSSTLENSTYDDTEVVVKKEESVEKVMDHKPPFVFELKSDSSASDQAFECVYDFCMALEAFCRSTSVSSHRLDIEKDWHKLLLTCSSHNYDRFMWIHLTFQSTLRLKLRWKQVVTRLMSKFDVPERRILVEELLSSFRYFPELATIATNSIHMVNSDFRRYADELGDDPAKIINYYVNGMPLSIKQVIESTMQYDETKHFKYTLLDIQQRATVFITTKEDRFIFYSKSAHLAISLEIEKGNSNDCEFHLLAEHSTSNCPDYVIVRYPYMDFTPLIVAASVINDVEMGTSSSSPKLTPKEIPTSTVANSYPVNTPMTEINSITPHGLPSTVEGEDEQMCESGQLTASLPINQTENYIAAKSLKATEGEEQRQMQQPPPKGESMELTQTIPAQKTFVSKDQSPVTDQIKTTVAALQLHTTETHQMEPSGNPPLPHAQDIANAMLRIQAKAQAQMQEQERLQVHTSVPQVKTTQPTESEVPTSINQSPQNIRADSSTTTVNMAGGIPTKLISAPLFNNNNNNSQVPIDPRLQIPIGSRVTQSLSAPSDTLETFAEDAQQRFQFLMAMTIEQRIQSLAKMSHKQKINFYSKLNERQKASLFENVETSKKPSNAVGQIPKGPSAMIDTLERKNPSNEKLPPTVHYPIKTSAGLLVGTDKASSSFYQKSLLPTQQPAAHQIKRSPSHSPRYDRQRRSASPGIPRSKSSSPEETGCYVHGAKSKHSTKDCRKAQLLIQHRPNHGNSADSEGKKRFKSGKKDEPNICIFCGLDFKPGHLAHCKKAPPRKKNRRN